MSRAADGRPRLKDVGAVAGVSAQTVSRVVNGHPHVSTATRVAVERALSDLRYRVNAGAQILASGRSTLVGVLVDETGSGGMEGELVAAGQRRGRLVVPVRVGPSTVVEGLDRLLELSVGCVVACLPDEPLGAARDALSDGPALVAVGPGELGVPRVALDDAGAAYRVTRTLLDEGRARVWLVADERPGPRADGWRSGWARALAERRVEPLMLPGDGTVATGHDIGCLLAGMADVGAVLVVGHGAATGLALGLAEGGLRVPDDVVVVSADHDHRPGRLPGHLRSVGGDRASLADAALDRALSLSRGPGTSAVTGRHALG